MRASATRQQARAAAAAEGTPHLVFRAGDEDYTLPLLTLREIVDASTLEPAADGPAALRGLVAVRGEAVPVVDVPLALGVRRPREATEPCVLVVWDPLSGGALVGLWVDGVRGVTAVASDGIFAPPRVGAPSTGHVVGALARAGQRLVPVLDLARLLATEEVRTALATAGRPERQAQGAPK